MKYLNWNSEKNDILKQERGISFEEIAYLVPERKLPSHWEGLGEGTITH